MKHVSARTDFTQPPISLWQAALDQSVSGLLVYEAVRNEKGKTTAFRVLLANRKAEQILGISKADMIGRTTQELFPPNPATSLWQDIETVIETGQAHHSELFYRVSRTKLDHWFELGIEPLGDGERAVVSFADITQLKTSQQDLLGEAILFQALSSTVPDTAVVVVNFFQKVVFANGNIPGLFVSRNPDDLLDRRLNDVIVPDYRADWLTYIRAALAGEEHSFSDHWGGSRCEVFVGPVRNRAGAVVMALAVYKDVTEQYRQQQVLQQMNNALQQSNQSLEQFAYVASHDLQEPLRKIKSFSGMLQSRYADQMDAPALALFDRMGQAADRMGELIRSLLSYARITQQQHSFDEIDLNGLLTDILSDLDVVIQEKDARIDIHPLPSVAGDATQLRQLFQNLITNALKFTKPGQPPRLLIVGRKAVAADVPGQVIAEEDQPFVEISVADNGIGIEPANFERIFGLFNRLHSRTTYAGTGIGLATVKRVAENHGGSVAVSSEPGKGTTFRVYLPVGVKRMMNASRNDE